MSIGFGSFGGFEPVSFGCFQISLGKPQIKEFTASEGD